MSVLFLEQVRNGSRIQINDLLHTGHTGSSRANSPDNFCSLKQTHGFLEYSPGEINRTADPAPGFHGHLRKFLQHFALLRAIKQWQVSHLCTNQFTLVIVKILDDFCSRILAHNDQKCRKLLRCIKIKVIY